MSDTVTFRPNGLDLPVDGRSDYIRHCIRLRAALGANPRQAANILADLVSERDEVAWENMRLALLPVLENLAKILKGEML